MRAVPEASIPRPFGVRQTFSKKCLRSRMGCRNILSCAKRQRERGCTIGMSSNGRTADSGSVNGGSTPSIPAILHMARSSSGSGRRPLKAEITSSNLVRATKCSTRVARPGFLFSHTCWQIAAAGGSECRPRRVTRPAARHSAALAGATALFGCADGCDGPVSYSRFDGGALCPSWQDCDSV